MARTMIQSKNRPPTFWTALGNGMKDASRSLYETVRDYRSSRKITLDRYLDPALFWSTANAAYLYGGDKALDYVSEHAEQHEGLAMLGTYGALAAGFWYVNKHAILPLAKRISAMHKKRRAQGKQATALSWVRTASQVGTMAALYAGLNFQETVHNYKYDGERVVHAFAREPIVEKPLESLPPEQLLPPLPPLVEEGTEIELQQLPQTLVVTSKPYSTGILKGRKFDDLFADYTGVNGTVPEHAQIDFDQQLDTLWRKKMQRTDNAVVKQVYNDQVQTYIRGEPTRMTLDAYIREADASIKDVRDHLDWNIVRKQKGLTQHETALVKAIATSLTGKDLLAYGLTELMPGRDGQLNVAVLDFLLRNAGREYVELLPALHDDKTSFGLYQFTEYALYDANGEQRGASIVNHALPEKYRIPGSVAYLKGNDHHKAAYMFAINNLSALTKKLNRSEYDVLAKHWKENKDDIVKFIATAHHGPAGGIKAARQWLYNDAKADFKVSCGGRYLAYAQKTDANYRALH